MSSEELQELQENAEHAKHNPGMAPVTLTMAILAVCVAVVSLLGHRAHTEEVVTQSKASDQWAFYQAKNIRRHADEMFTDLTSVEAITDPAAAAKLRAKYSDEATRYKDEQKEIEDEAKKLEAEVATVRTRADWLDLAEVFLEVGLVVTSITLLSGRKLFWFLGLIMGALGVIVAAVGALLH